MFRNLFKVLSKSSAYNRFFLLLCSFLTCSSVYPQIHTTANVVSPTGGFTIDGDLRSNTPDAGTGDWFQGLAGAGGYVFTTTASSITPTAVDPSTSGWKRDLFNSTSDNVFASGSKFNDYISALRWTTSSAPDKNDIQNGLYHVSREQGTNAQWAFIAGDRLSTNGTSYIDFEFLQGTLTTVTGGTFTSTPLSSKNNGGGRTEGDLLISMEYTNGGTAPNVYIYQWTKSGTTWFYNQIFAGSSSSTYAETNRVVESNVSYMPFGASSYQPFAFVEAAINISQIIANTSQANFCTNLNIKTLWIKTKASASSTAALKDFMEPIPVNLNFGSTSIDALGPFCANDVNPHTLSATPPGGNFSGPGVTGSSGGTFSFTASPLDAGTYTITYNASGCTATTTVTVLPIATASISATGSPACKNGTSPKVTFTASGGAGTYTFTYKLNDGTTETTNTIPTVSGNTVTLTVPVTTAGTFTYTLLSVQNSTCTNAATGTVTIAVNENPTASAYASGAQCFSNSGNVFTLTGTPGYATSHTWAAVGLPSGVTAPIFNVNANTTTVTVNATTTGGTFTFTYTASNSTSGCPAATATTTVTIYGVPAKPSVCAVQPSICNPNGIVNFSTLGSYYSINDGGTWTTCSTITVKAGTVTSVRIQDANGCISAPTSCSEIGTCTSTVPTSCGISPITLSKNPGPSTSTAVQDKPLTQEISFPDSRPSVLAFPNPFSNKIKFIVTAPERGRGALELFNVLGQKIKTVYQGEIREGTQVFETFIPPQQRVNIIYVMTLNGKTASGKMIAQ